MIIKLIIIIVFIFPMNNVIENKYSNITLKVKGPGFKKVLSSSFIQNYYPNLTIINGKENTTIGNEFYFDQTNNTAILIWDNNIDNCYGMFRECNDINMIDLSDFDTSKVINMGGMFSGCSSLISINLSNFQTSNVEIMDRMFYNCSSLTSLNLSNFDTSKVWCMNHMFYNCSSLISLNLSNFDTSNVHSMNHMFYNCSSLTSLNLSNFDTSNVLDMEYMFYGCSKLEYINLKNFTEKSLGYSYVYDIFVGVPDNVTICLNTNNTKIFDQLNKTVNYYTLNCSNYFQLKKPEINKIESMKSVIENLEENQITPKTKEEEAKYFDKIFESTEEAFLSEDYDTFKIDSGKEEQINLGKAKMTITSARIQKNNINSNTTSIDLGECEVALRNFYNISNDSEIYMIKIEIIQEGMRIPKIEYKLFAKINEIKKKLNLNACQNIVSCNLFFTKLLFF